MVCCSIILMAALHCIFAHMGGENLCECYLPVFLVHGTAEDKTTLDLLVERIELEHAGTIVFNSNAYPGLSSFTPMYEQVYGELGRQFRRFSADHSCGIVLLGYSQGALLSRALVEVYPDHNVHTLILLAGSVAGRYGYPTFIAELEPFVNEPLTLDAATDFLYTQEAQDSFSVANYWRDPHRLHEYLKMVSFLPDIDCEVYSRRCIFYKTSFERLKVVLAIGGKDDGFEVPYESGFFSYYRDNSDHVESFRDRYIYTNNTFGLRTLDEQGRFIIHNVPGVEHLQWPVNPVVFQKFILPYLPSNPAPCHP